MNNSPSFQKPETFRQALPWITLVAFMFVFSYLNRAVFGPLLGFIEQEMSLSHSESTLFLLYIAIGYALSVLASAVTCSLMRPRHMVGLATIASGITLIVLSQTHGKGMLSFLFFLGSSLILTLRNQAGYPWSCKQIRPLRAKPYSGAIFHFPLFFKANHSGVQASNSTILAPFNQCST